MEKFTQIEQLRKQSNMSQEQLAELLGISRQTVSEWERGIAYPSVEKLLFLSKIFNVSLDYIITGKEFNANKYSVLDVNNKQQLTKKDLKEKGYSSKEINMTLNSDEFKYTLLSHTDSLLFGRNGKYYVSTKENAPIGNSLVVASAGAGKSRCFLKPNICQAIKRGESLIINDVAGEELYFLKEKLEENGYKIQCIDFLSKATSYGFLQDIPDDIFMAEKYIRIIYNNLIEPYETTKENYFNQLMFTIFHAAVSYILFSKQTNFRKTLYSVSKLLTQYTCKELIKLLEDDTENKFNDYNILKSQNIDILERIYTTLTITLSGYFRNISDTSKNKNIPIYNEEPFKYNITDVYKEKIAVFLISPCYFTNDHPISNLFKLYINMLTYLLHEERSEIKQKTFICLDEFANLAQPINNFSLLLKNSYSLKVSIVVIIQSITQLEYFYDLKEIQEYFDNIVYLRSSNEIDLERFSKMFDISINELKYNKEINMYVKRHDEIVCVQKINDVEKVFNLPNR